MPLRKHFPGPPVGLPWACWGWGHGRPCRRECGQVGATQSDLPGCGWWVVRGYTRQKWGQAGRGHDALWVQVMGRHWGWGSRLWPPGHTGLCLPSVPEEVGGLHLIQYWYQVMDRQSRGKGEGPRHFWVSWKLPCLSAEQTDSHGHFKLSPINPSTLEGLRWLLTV